MKKPTPDAGQKPLRPAVIRKNTVTSPEKNNKPASRSFFIVGIGASAGGLEELEQQSLAKADSQIDSQALRDPDLAKVIAAWPILAPAMHAAVMAIANSSKT